MNMKEKVEKGRGYLTSIIAVVFLIIGYQTALFVHQAAVMKITANRDEPDTIYIYEYPDSRSSGARAGAAINRVAVEVKRKNADHSDRAAEVRANVPRKTVESFQFNPNTASVEDLCRLGFSPKQAASIVEYRNKGGKFRRKSDFARSFVVSDSIYKRLEPYIDIPLIDLNLADSAAFDTLPGIGGWFASKMVEYRKELGGYSYKEQLMDIWKFDREKYDKLADLITIDTAYIKPYPLWTHPVDSLRLHPYIRNYETARAIVLFRENNLPDSCTVSALARAGILPPDLATKLSHCVIQSAR
jgi:DNA uptake protein ComE-like DNA-binding protein